MKTYKIVPAHIIERKAIDKIYCDVTGREIPDEPYEKAHVNISLSEYSYGDMISCYQIDMHPEVFMNEFIEWIKSKNPNFELKDTL